MKKIGKIEIYKNKGSWFADSSHAADAARIFELFGSHQIPTAFLTRTPVETVITELKRLNPGHEVVAK